MSCVPLNWQNFHLCILCASFVCSVRFSVWPLLLVVCVLSAYHYALVCDTSEVETMCVCVVTFDMSRHKSFWCENYYLSAWHLHVCEFNCTGLQQHFEATLFFPASPIPSKYCGSAVIDDITGPFVGSSSPKLWLTKKTNATWLSNMWQLPNYSFSYLFIGLQCMQQKVSVFGCMRAYEQAHRHMVDTLRAACAHIWCTCVARGTLAH